jgi:predicted metal-dependent hydrolase
VSEWPPREQRLRGALFQGKRKLVRGQYAHAAAAFERAAAVAGADEKERVRGLLHLAAAGCRLNRGDELRARRQLAHARRRLGAAPAPVEGVELAGLLEAVERALPPAQG